MRKSLREQSEQVKAVQKAKNKKINTKVKEKQKVT